MPAQREVEPRLELEPRIIADGEPGLAERVDPAPERLREALARRGIHSDAAGDGAVVVLEATPEVVGAIAAEQGVVLYGLDAERESLEDVFLALTGGPRNGRKEARR